MNYKPVIALSLAAAVFASPVSACGWLNFICQARVKQASTNLAKAAKICKTRLSSHVYKTHVEYAKCMNDSFEKYAVPVLASVELSNLRLMEAYRTSLAKDIDDGKISQEKADLQWAQFMVQIDNASRQNELAEEDRQRQIGQLLMQFGDRIANPPTSSCTTTYNGYGAWTTNCR
jgi:hypothetical protein